MRSQAWIKGALILSAALLLGGFLGGCATAEGDDPYDKIITRDTELHENGTATSTVVRDLQRGVRLRTLGMSGDGLMEIQTVSGDHGYVDQDAIGDQPPEDSPIKHSND